MLNFKHLSFVHPSLFNLFFSDSSSSKSKKEDFSNVLDEWIRFSNGVCGVLTLSFDKGKSLEEIASVGYGEDGFFYSFYLGLLEIWINLIRVLIFSHFGFLLLNMIFFILALWAVWSALFEVILF